ncbi:signal recognition particle-docking protein FtsY [Methanosphaera sp. WGK6]|uniref:signal recognition particle-docking protein FtsY n=1 Tax=Methanosphaera sp. WGK6 TaxID=1561964 RepID=UPI00084C20A3|nr:signal recognition particle-docking protein FtsY [Methanosphaera sp. WGK6]OED30111.1 cell division protein FtsY [Methanosphaera sp. WGK6]
MFDFIRKRINKTIKDSEKAVPEDEITEQESIEEPVEEEIEETSETEEVESNEEEEKSADETEEKSHEPLEEETIDETEEESDSEEEKEDKKGFFGFLRRNKNKKEDEEEKEPEQEELEKQSNDTSEEKLEDSLSEEDETINEPSEIKEESEEKSDAEKETKYDGEEKGSRFGFITKKTIKEEDIEEILEELEFSLIEGDVAFDVADRIVEAVKEDLIGRKIKRRGDMELFTTNALKKAITEIIDNGYYDLLGDIEAAKSKGEPYKIMFVGINGTGKTTTIAKIAKYLEKHNYSSVLGASDTFRAGAIEQLEYHAKNLNLKIIKHERNSDPAAVAYDTVEHAKATGKDVVLIDTSGRMQTNANLMDEMKKIKRVSQPDIVLYVGDALMGNDATEQATKFNEVIDIDGIILTKADADAKGGAAISIGHVINKPILFIGTGQSYDDLMEFEPSWMINQIFGEEEA